MIWGLAPGPNMSAGVEKRARKSGSLQSHVVLEATASFSRGEKHTFLGCQGLYSACWVLLALLVFHLSLDGAMAQDKKRVWAFFLGGS